jgi:hypothetical protein
MSTAESAAGARAVTLAPRRAPWWLGAYAGLLLAGAWLLAHQVNPDGVAYLRLAEYWARGEVARAVSGYWSPLYSWLLAPWLLAGVPGLLAAKCLGALLALAWVVAVSRLARRWVTTPWGRGLVAAVAGLWGLGWALSLIGPDFLLAVLLTSYFCVVVDPAVLRRPARALGAGLLGGVAFLAKAYALPFVASHLLVTLALHAAGEPRGRRLRRMALGAAAGLGGVALAAGPWIAVLSATYGEPTVTRAVGRNRPLVADESVFLPWALRIPPELRLNRVEPGRLTTWETPERFVPTLLSGPPATDPAAIRWGLVAEILGNVVAVRDRLAGVDALHLGLAGLVAAALLAAFGPAERARRLQDLWGVLTVAQYAAGFVPLVAREERYFWPVGGLLAILAVSVAERGGAALAPGAPAGGMLARRAVTGAVAASFLLAGAVTLVETVRASRPDYGALGARLAAVARQHGVRRPVPLAGNEWGRPLYTAYAMGWPMHGMAASREPEALARDLRAAAVGLFLVFEDRTLAARLRASPAFTPLGDFGLPRARRLQVSAFLVEGAPGLR